MPSEQEITAACFAVHRLRLTETVLAGRPLDFVQIATAVLRAAEGARCAPTSQEAVRDAE